VLNALRRRVVAAAPLRLARQGLGQARRRREFLKVARQSFVELQAAWDRADWPTLQALATAPLVDDLREQHALRGPGPHHTEVLELHAELLALEDLREALLASVEFHGLIREQVDAILLQVFGCHDLSFLGCTGEGSPVRELYHGFSEPGGSCMSGARAPAAGHMLGLRCA
jgi:hypothetical protein